MFKYVLVAALLGAAYGGVVPFESPLGAALVPRVNIAPTKLTVVKQPVTVQQTETVYHSVPVPLRTVAYTNPQVQVAAPHYVAQPQVYAAPIGLAAVPHGYVGGQHLVY